MAEVLKLGSKMREVPMEKPFDVVGFIMDFEGGDITEERLIEGFQHMIDDGSVWKLQGSYGRTAHALIEQGYCHARGEK